MKTKKYPLLISAIISFVIIVASLFVLGFAGMNLGTSLGGGSEFEVNVASGASAKDYVSKIKAEIKKNGYTFDSSAVEDNYVAIDDEGNYTTQTIVVKITQNNLTDEQKSALVKNIATALSIDESYVTLPQNIIAEETSKSVLSLGIAIGVVAVALFVFAWIRYDVFAGLSFIIAFLHNIILYLSLTIITRLPLSLFALTMVFIFTIIMSVVLIHIYENYRKESRLHIADKLTVAERMIACEKQAIKPFAFIAVASIVAFAFMIFVPLSAVKFMALAILMAVVVTAYTSLLVGPECYVALLDIRETRLKAILSRNDTVNKAIKKKIKNSKKEAEVSAEATANNVEPEKTQEIKAEPKAETKNTETVEETETKKVARRTTTTNKYATRKNTKKKK